MTAQITSFLAFLWIALFIVLAIGTVVNLKLAHSYVSIMKDSFPHKLAEVTNGNVVTGEVVTQARILKFVLSRAYEELDSLEVTSRGDRFRISLILYFAVCGLFFVCTFALLI